VTDRRTDGQTDNGAKNNMSPHFMGGDIIHELMRMAEAMRRKDTIQGPLSSHRVNALRESTCIVFTCCWKCLAELIIPKKKYMNQESEKYLRKMKFKGTVR